MNTPLPNAILQQLAGLNALDWILVLVLAWSMILALFRGLIREIFSLAGTILGLLLACWNYQALASNLSPWMEWSSSPVAAEAIAFILIALSVLIACTLLGRLVRGTAHTVGLGMLDRIAGAGFGTLRGALLGLGIIIAVTNFLPVETLAQNSRLAPYFLAAAREVSFVVPQDLQKRITVSIDDIRRIARR